MNYQCMVMILIILMNKLRPKVEVLMQKRMRSKRAEAIASISKISLNKLDKKKIIILKIITIIYSISFDNLLHILKHFNKL